jgi:hypothetical protein
MSADQSAALQEEIESINAIYGENTVTATSSSDVFVLTLPFHSTSLRISFPPTYPEVAPSILGPESSLQSSSAESGAAPTKKGDAADFADLARQVLQTCFHVGEPCIFDLLEDLRTRIEERREFTTLSPATARRSMTVLPKLAIHPTQAPHKHKTSNHHHYQQQQTRRHASQV